MKQVGKIPVTISLQGKIRRDDILIFPGVSCALISWKAAKELCILSPQYPYPKGVLATDQTVCISRDEKHQGDVQLQQHWRAAHKGIPISIQWTDQWNGRTLHSVIDG